MKVKQIVDGEWKTVEVQCLSTHGGAGYAPGSYRHGGWIVCGLCLLKIENPAAPKGRNK